jgi:MFS family permease
MNARLRRTLLWGPLVFAVALLVADVLALVTNSGDGIDTVAVAVLALMAIVYGVVGLLVASRQPENPIGWIFLGASLFTGLANVTDAYAASFNQTRDGPQLLGRAAAAYGEVAWMPFILVPATFLLLLFPTGHLLSRRWRWVARCAGIGIAGAFVFVGVDPGPIPTYPQLTNPFGVHSPLLTPLQVIASSLVGIGVIGSSVSLVVRFRRARGVERQQLKGLALAGGVVAVTLALYGVVGAGTADVLSAIGVLGLPAAAGVAILRYRLYDIDVVINRTLVYGALTAILAAIYVGSVLLLQLALSPFVEGSSLAVAVSTLAVAALFRPVRSRIQDVVDRRFFRSKYDAARTLTAFSSHMRDQVDLADIGADLLTVVSQTVQPTHASLWLRSPQVAP